MSHLPDSPNLIIGWFKDELNAQAYKAIYGIKEKLTNYYHAHEFMTEDFNLIVDAVTDLLHKDRAEVRRDALLDVCKMQCWMCEENKELAPGKEFNHKMNGWLAECHAHDVRRMIAAEQGKESK